MEGPSPTEVQSVSRGYRSILVVGGPKLNVQKELSPHEFLSAKNLEISFEIVTEKKPDLVIYFAPGKDERLEEHVMTWLIAGFRGRIVVMDSAGAIRDADALLEGMVIDEYLSGPLSPTRFVSIVKSHLDHTSRYGSPRALTTFDLFRNLYERGLNAIFFFSEDLNRCLVANVAAEQLMGRSLYELRRTGLSDLCQEDQYERTVRVLRRAARSYYDVQGSTAVSDRRGRRIETTFSCGWLDFGRSRFLKMELQTPPSRRREDRTAADQAALWGAVDRGLKASERGTSSLSLIWCRISPPEAQGDWRDEAEVLQQVHQAIIQGTRRTDTIVRASRSQFAILLPKTESDRAGEVAERLRKRILAMAPFRENRYGAELLTERCPPEAFSFMKTLFSPSGGGRGGRSG